MSFCFSSQYNIESKERSNRSMGLLLDSISVSFHLLCFRDSLLFSSFFSFFSCFFSHEFFTCFAPNPKPSRVSCSRLRWQLKTKRLNLYSCKIKSHLFFPEMKFKRKLNHIRQKKQLRNGSMLSVPCFSSERRRNRIILTLMRFFVSWFHECHLILAPHDVNMSCSDGRHRIQFLGSKECM